MTPELMRRIIALFIIVPIISIGIYLVFFFGHLNINTDVSDFVVAINGYEHKNNERIRLQQGNYDIVLYRPKYYSINYQIEIKKFQDTDLTPRWRYIPQTEKIDRNDINTKNIKDYDYLDGNIFHTKTKKVLTQFVGLDISDITENKNKIIVNSNKGSYLVDKSSGKKLKINNERSYLLDDYIFSNSFVYKIEDISKQEELNINFNTVAQLNKDVILGTDDQDLWYIDLNNPDNNYLIDSFSEFCSVENCKNPVSKIEIIDEKNLLVQSETGIWKIQWLE